MTPRGIAMGEGVRGQATGALGPLANPSGMALVKQYSIEGMYGFSFRDLGSNLHLSIVDSVTSRIAAGIYYNFVHSSPRFHCAEIANCDPQREGHETGLALAMALGDYLTFGLTAKYITVTTDIVNAGYVNSNGGIDPGTMMPYPKRRTIDSSTAGASLDGFTADAGLTLKLGESFSVGLVGYNLVPLKSVEAPIAMGLGLSYHPGPALTIGLDGELDFNRFKTVDKKTMMPADEITLRVGGGAEYTIQNHVPIRVGILHDTGEVATYLSCGVGYMSTNFGVDLSFRQQVGGGDNTLLLAGIRLFLE